MAKKGTELKGKLEKAVNKSSDADPSIMRIVQVPVLSQTADQNKLECLELSFFVSLIFK